MERKEIELFLGQFNIEKIETVFLADTLDEAFIGLDTSGDVPVAVYSVEKTVQILCREMTEEEAWEYFHFNVEAARVGPQTPRFIHTPP